MTAGANVGMVQTVLGPIKPEELGVTHTHEHLLADLSHWGEPPEEASALEFYYRPVTPEVIGYSKHYRDIKNADNAKLLSVDEAIYETNLFKQHGGGTLVECSSKGLRRDPHGLRRIATATGVNVVMGASYYVFLTHPPDMDDKTEDDITDEIVSDLTGGVKTQVSAITPDIRTHDNQVMTDGIQAGIIGEVGCSWPLTDNERKVLRASARAQQLTGAPITIHPGREDRAPLEIIEVLREAGADLSRTAMGHLCSTVFERETLKEIAETGVYLQWDQFGTERSYLGNTPWRDMPNDAKRLDDILYCISLGREDGILMAHDICSKDRLIQNAGHGYFYILRNIVPRMRHRGFSDEAVHKALVENPARILTMAEPKAA